MMSKTVTESGWCEIVERVFSEKRLSPVVVARWSRVLADDPELADSVGIDRTYLGRLRWLGLGIWRLSDLLPKLHQERERFARAVAARRDGGVESPRGTAVASMLERFCTGTSERLLLDTVLLVSRDIRAGKLAEVLKKSHYNRQEILAMMTGLSRSDVSRLLNLPRLAAVVSAIEVNGIDPHGKVKRSRRQRVAQPRRVVGIQHQLEWAQ